MSSFVNRLSELNITISEEQERAFNTYYELLTEWNKVMNLTAITEREEVYTKHFIDSLAITDAVNSIVRTDTDSPLKALMQQDWQDTPLKMLDLGTGAGFPGIPLKIVFPHLKITLLDSLNKRIKFLNEVITQLNLEGIEAIHGRAEELAGKNEFREQYDICVSRAVANLATLSEYCIPYVKTGGYFISYKSGNIEEEVENAGQAVKLLGAQITKVCKCTLPDTDIERSFVIIHKIAKTPKKYPRKAGTPSKEPLR